MKKYSLSVIVPAYNEEKNITSAIGDAKLVLRKIKDWELIVIDDGSTDNTGSILSKIKKSNPRMRIIKHDQNMGFGQSIKDGIAAAKKEYITQFHGDNDAAASSIRLMLENMGEADLIISYTADARTRSLLRRMMSKLFVVVMNMLFGMRLKYFNGCFLCKRKILQSIPLTSTGFAIYAEAKVRLIKAGATYKEVPFEHTGRKHGASKAVSLKSFFETLNTITMLIWDIYFLKDKPHINSTRREGISLKTGIK